MDAIRRRLILAAGAAMAAYAVSGTASAQPSAPGWLGDGLARDETGAIATIFGLGRDEALEVLMAATKASALPDGYTPADLVSASRLGIAAAGTQLIRRIVADDTRALVAAAQADGVDVYVGSGFRSQSYQVTLFAAQVARWGSEEVANRYSALPGHSQHQLGTTIDFTDNFRAFRESSAAEWLRGHAHKFGFVLPYTEAAQELTGYVPEPWHARWVGAALASALQAAGYQTWADRTADDALAQVVDAAR